MNFERIEVYDCEVFPNLFVLVSKSLADGKVNKFVIGDNQDDFNEIRSWLKTKPVLCGFNSLQFDGIIVELIWRSSKKVTAKEIYDFIEDFWAKRKEDHWYAPYKEWDMSFTHLDLFAVNHFSNANKMTSLKWLEFTMRLPRMTDMPIPAGSVIPASSILKIVSYCLEDVKATEAFYTRCLSMIELRKELAEIYQNPRILNMSNSSIGEFIIKDSLKKEGLTEKQIKATIPRETIAVADCILDYIAFQSPEYTAVLDVFKSIVLDNVQETGLKGVHEQEVILNGTTYKFAVGGIHGLYKPGIYVSDEENVILSWDASSFYPWLSIANEFYPEHLGKTFCRVYENIYNERTKYAKNTSRNKAYKESLVCIYGKSNSKFSGLYDPTYTIKTVVNGQLSLLMLIEELSKLGTILLANTDGFEILLPRKYVDQLHETVAQFECITGLKMEYETYTKLVVRDVNAYLAISEKGTVKRKNLFRIYQDFTEIDEKGTDQEHHYDEAPNGTIIAEALNDYYVKGIPVEETIMKCNDIYPFLYGLKGRKGFDYELFTLNEKEETLDREVRTERAIRFFIKKGGAFMFKRWRDGRKNDSQVVKKGQRVQTAMNIVKKGQIQTITKSPGNQNKESIVIPNYEPDRQYYIDECYKIINAIENGKVFDEITEVEE